MPPRFAIFPAAVLILAAAAPADPPPVDPPVKADPKALLSGVWELRADDGRTARLVLRPDGTMIASSGDGTLPDFRGVWSLVTESGNRYTFECGREGRPLDNYRVTVVLT